MRINCIPRMIKRAGPREQTYLLWRCRNRHCRGLRVIYTYSTGCLSVNLSDDSIPPITCQPRPAVPFLFLLAPRVVNPCSLFISTSLPFNEQGKPDPRNLIIKATRGAGWDSLHPIFCLTQLPQSSITSNLHERSFRTKSNRINRPQRPNHPRHHGRRSRRHRERDAGHEGRCHHDGKER